MKFQKGFVVELFVPCAKLKSPGPSIVPAAKLNKNKYFHCKIGKEMVIVLELVPIT